MYGMIKTRKESNPARIIISRSGTAVESLSTFVEKCLFPEVLKIGTRIQDTQHMLNMVDDLNRNGNFHENYSYVILVIVYSFMKLQILVLLIP